MKAQKTPVAAPAATPPATAENPAATPPPPALETAPPPTEKEDDDIYWDLGPHEIASLDPRLLLPPGIVRKFMEIWHYTGVNAAHVCLRDLLHSVEDPQDMGRTLKRYLACGLDWKVDNLAEKWCAREGRKAWWEIDAENRAQAAAAKATTPKEVRP